MNEGGIKTPKNGEAGEKGGFTMTVSLDPFPLKPVGEIEVIPSQHLIRYRVDREQIEALFEHYRGRLCDPGAGPGNAKSSRQKGVTALGQPEGEIPAGGNGEPQDRIPADIRDRLRVASGL